jgi:hypothetical protein
MLNTCRLLVSQHSFVFQSVYGLWCLTPLSTIFQLYRYGQFYWWRKPEYPDKILSHNVVSSTPRLSGIRTHNVSETHLNCTQKAKDWATRTPMNIELQM